MSNQQTFDVLTPKGAIDFLVIAAKSAPAQGNIEQAAQLFEAINTAQKTLQELIPIPNEDTTAS